MLEGLKLSSPISQDEKEALKIIFNDIIALQYDDNSFQDLILIFLDGVPSETRDDYVKEIKPYIEKIIEKDFGNINLPRFYNFLNRSETETLDYILDLAANFDKDKFNNFMTNCTFKKLAENKNLFMSIELRLWQKLAESEKLAEPHSFLFQNIKTLVNEFINLGV